MASAAVVLVLLPWVPIVALAYGLLPFLIHPRRDGRLVAEPGWTRAAANTCIVALPLYAFGAEWLSVPVAPVRGTWVALSVAGLVIPLAVAWSVAARRHVLVPALVAALPVAAAAHYMTRFEAGIGVTGDGLVVALLPGLALVVGVAGGARPDRILATAMLAGPLGVVVGADLLRLDLLVGTYRLIVLGGGGLHDLVALSFLVPVAVDALRTRHFEERRHGRARDREAAVVVRTRRDIGLLGRRVVAHGIDMTLAGLLFSVWWAAELRWGVGGDLRVLVWLGLQAPFVAPWLWESLFRRTLGHRALGLAVVPVAADGGVDRIALWTRGLFRYLDLLLLYGPLWQTGRRIGDLAAGTRVANVFPAGRRVDPVHCGALET